MYLGLWRPLWRLLPLQNALRPLPLQNAMIWRQLLFLRHSLQLACFLFSPRLFFNSFWISLHFEYHCLGFYLIKQLPNCISVSPNHSGSVVDHQNLGWKSPSGLTPLPALGWAVAPEHCSFLIGWCNILRGNCLLNFPSMQASSWSKWEWNGTIPNKKGFFFFFGQTDLINKRLLLSWRLLSLPEVQLVSGEENSFLWKKNV